MSDFKHSLNVTGSSIDRFKKDLQSIGYREYLTDTGHTLGVNGFNSGGTTNPNGTYRETNNPQSRDYEFNIDNENEYKTALGIAGMRVGNEYYAGEWSVFNDKYITGGKDEMRFIIADGKDFPASQNYCSLGAAKQIPGYRKATADEIIKFFNTNKTNKMEDFKLPEKWIVLYRNKEEFNKLNKWKDNLWGYISPEKYHRFLGGCYPSHVPSSTNLGWIGNEPSFKARLNEGYREITFEQFEKYVLKAPQQGKELIGYKLNGVVSKEIVDRVIKYKMPEYNGLYFVKGHLGGSLVQEAKNLGILDKWFIPVYEEQSEVLVIGSRSVNVKIERGRITAKGYNWPIDSLNKVIDGLNKVPSFPGLYDVSLVELDTRYVRIGCREEDNRFSINELLSVKKVYDKLNK